MTAWLPVALKLAGRRCLVVGGGQVAERRTLSLLEAEASVRVIAPDVTDVLRDLAAAGAIELLEREYAPGMMADAFLVVVATNNGDVNRAVREEARASGALVNDATGVEAGDVVLEAAVRRGDLIVSVTTLGASPSLAMVLCNRLEREIGPEYTQLTVILREARVLAAQSGASARARQKVLADLAADGTLLDLIRSGQVQEARSKALSCISSLSD